MYWYSKEYLQKRFWIRVWEDIHFLREYDFCKSCKTYHAENVRIWTKDEFFWEWWKPKKQKKVLSCCQICYDSFIIDKRLKILDELSESKPYKIKKTLDWLISLIDEQYAR